MRAIGPLTDRSSPGGKRQGSARLRPSLQFRPRSRWWSGCQPPKHVMEDSARAEIFELVVGIDAAARGEAGAAAVFPGDVDRHGLARLDVGDAGDGKLLGSVEAQSLGILSGLEVEW